MFGKQSEDCIIMHDPYTWEIKKLNKLGDLLIDTMSGKAFSRNGSKITIIKGRKKNSYILLDGEKGVGLELNKEIEVPENDVRIEKDETVIKLKTNPELTYQLIEGGLLLKLLRIKPTMGQVVAGVILGMIIGLILGGILF